MTVRVVTPRRVFLSMGEFAALLNTAPPALYERYLEPDGPGAWRLRPLDEDAYRAWHRTVYARAQRRKAPGRPGRPRTR